MKDVETFEDVKVFVDRFYEKAKQDELLGPIFQLRIEEREWAQHVEQIYQFWYSLLFSEKMYQGNPFAKHIGLPIQKMHFDQWTQLFKQTIAENFAGTRADEAKHRADTIAALFLHKLKHIQPELSK